MMTIYPIIASIESQEASDAFKKYMDGLNLKPEIREKLEIWDLEHPLCTHGFHPATIMHMKQFSDNQNN